MQPFLLIYDITDLKIRDKLVEICLDYGLSRIQKSSFLGFLEPRWAKKLSKECRELMTLNRKRGDTYNVQLFPLSKEGLGNRVIISNKK